MDLSQELIRDLFDYDPLTGVVTRKRKSGKRGKGRAGDVVGSPMRKTKYLRVKINRKHYLLHRIIWMWVYGSCPRWIDHKNRKRDDNRLENLRPTSGPGNATNRSVGSNCTSGVTGVCWSKRKQRWRAYVHVNGRQRDIGNFRTIDEAIEARNKAALEHYGEFAPS